MSVPRFSELEILTNFETLTSTCESKGIAMGMEEGQKKEMETEKERKRLVLENTP